MALIGTATTGYLTGSAGHSVLPVSGSLALTKGSDGVAELRLHEDQSNGDLYTGWKAGNVTTSVVYAMPAADGSDGQQLTTGGSGVLTWAAAGSTSLAADDISSGDAAVSIDTSSGNITVDSNAGSVSVDGHTGLTLTSSDSGEIDITSAAAVDINATTGVTIDGTTVSIDGTDDVNLTVTSSTGGEDLTISQIGGNDSSILVTAAGTGTDAVSIDVTAGSMVIAPSLVDNKTLTIGNTNSTYALFSPDDTAADEKILIKNAAGTTDAAIKLWSAAGGITLLAADDSLHIDADGTDADALNIDSAGGIDIDAAGGVVLDAAASSTLTVATGGADADDFTVQVTGGGDSSLLLASDGTGTDAVSIDVTAGSMVVAPSLLDGKTLKLGKSGAVEVTIAPHSSAAAEMFSVKNTAGTLDGTQTGGVAIGAVNLTAVAGGMGLTWADGKALHAEGGRAVITANENAADCIKLHADVGATQTITVLNDAGTADGTNSNAAGIQLTSTAGGVGLAWNDAKDLWAEGGRAVITANEDAADCIKLHADAGTSQTINLLNDAGTSTAGIALTATAGGITLTTASSKVVTIAGGDLVPGGNGTLDLGGASLRWANIYTSDMHFANERGDWTLIEENDYITFRNNHTGRRFRMMMEDITDSGDFGPDINGTM